MALQNSAQTTFRAAQRNPDVIHGQPQPLPDFPIRQLFEMLQTDQLPVPGRELAKGRVDILSADSGIGITLFKVTGAMSFTDRQATVEQFVRQGGLLIGTDAALSEGIELGQMTDVIYYDSRLILWHLNNAAGASIDMGGKRPALCTCCAMNQVSILLRLN